MTAPATTTMTVTTVVPTATALPLSPLPSLVAVPPLAWPSPTVCECSLSSSDIDLSLRDDLSASVQDYLMRIVDELQQLSKWVAACQSRVVHCEQQHQQQQQQQRDERASVVHHQHQHEQARAALLLAQTETQLLRSDMQRLSQDVAQRATTQLAYVQNSLRTECSDQLVEAERRLDDKLRALSRETRALVEAARADADARATATDAALRALTQQHEEQQARLASLERHVAETLPGIATAQHHHERDLVAHQRWLHQLETATALQLNEFKSATGDSLTALQDAQTQLATKLLVVRTELQQQSDEHHQRTQQLLRSLRRVAGGQHVDLPRPSSPVVVPVGAKALYGHDSAATDCFLHAKAALSPRSEGSPDGMAKRQTLQPTALESAPLQASVSFGSARSAVSRQRGTVEMALRIHSSTLCQPVGREEQEASAVLLPATNGNGTSPRKASLRPHEATRTTTLTATTTLRPHAPHSDRTER